MYEYTLTPEQEIKARTELCQEAHCLKCNAPLLKSEDRFLETIPYRTKKHLYMNCFVVCRACHEDKKGTRRWWNNLDNQDLLYAVKDRSVYSITVK